MTLALEWSKQEEFRNEPLRDWYVDGAVAGMTRSGGGLTYATVRGADHFVSPFSDEYSLEDRLTHSKKFSDAHKQAFGGFGYA